MNTLNYWRRLVRLFFHYKRKSILLPYLPVRLWVELSGACNYRCIMCPNKDLPGKEKGNMDFGLYTKIIDETASYVFDINLAHRGESLIHPRIAEAADYAKQKGLYTRLHTNGSLLTEELSQKFIDSGLDRLSFSFDGYDAATYEKIRRGGKFDETVGNIVRLLEIKKKAGAKKPIVAIEVINFDQLQGDQTEAAKKKFLKNFKGLPLDHFVHKELHNWAGEIDRDKQEGFYSVCTFPWNALIIYWNGDVLPCTQDFFGQIVVGNANKTTLRDIWNGEKMVTLRKKLVERDVKGLKPCAGCDRLNRRGFLGIPKEYLWKFITKRMP
ncbi:MAG: SPASM domain-containing protein [Candidatus Aminicenantes bacterium]|nr:SPASM domain-containing protein [Candidatus Aminicenantes bacterium]